MLQAWFNSKWHLGFENDPPKADKSPQHLFWRLLVPDIDDFLASPQSLSALSSVGVECYEMTASHRNVLDVLALAQACPHVSVGVPRPKP